MVSAKLLTSKLGHDGGAQVPKEIREHLNLKEGDTLIWVVGTLGSVYVKRGAVVEAST